MTSSRSRIAFARRGVLCIALLLVPGLAFAAPASADIALSSSVSPSTVGLGGASTFSVTVRNNGVVSIPNVFFTADTSQSNVFGFASGLTGDASADGTVGTRCDSGLRAGLIRTRVCQTGALAGGQTRTFTFSVTPLQDPGTITARAQLAGPSTNVNGQLYSEDFPGDSNNANNSTSSTVTYVRPDIALSSSVSPSTVGLGGASRFSVIVRNNGVVSIPNVFFTAETSQSNVFGFSSGLTGDASADGTVGTRCDGGLRAGLVRTRICQTGALAAGQTRTFTFSVTPLQDPGTITARAALAGPSTNVNGQLYSEDFPGDSNNANNSTSSTVTYVRPDIALSSSVSPSTVGLGGASKFSVTVRNKGAAVSNVFFNASTSQANSLGSSGLTNAASADGTVGTRCDPGAHGSGVSTTICQTGALAAGQTRTFTFSVGPRQTAGTVIARAALAGPTIANLFSPAYPGDSDSSNDTAESTVTYLLPHCSNGLDDDGDGTKDGRDPGCNGPSDVDERDEGEMSARGGLTAAGGQAVTFSAVTNCLPELSTKPFVVQWGATTFTRTSSIEAACRNDLAVTPAPAIPTGFDTQTGRSTGKLSSGEGATVEWRFVDGGASSNDRVSITIYNSDDTAILTIPAQAPGPMSDTPGGVTALR